MLTRNERLQALHAEASREYIRFRKRMKRKTAVSKWTSATVAMIALATGITAAAGISVTATAALATLLLMATGVKLVLTDTERDRDLHRLTDAWRRHRDAASLLLARNRAQRAGDAAERVHHDTIELERWVAETRSDSLLLDPDTGIADHPTGKPAPAAAPPTNGNS